MRIKLFLLLSLFSLGAFAQDEVVSQKSSIYLIITSYNPDTKRMSDFISDFEKNAGRISVPHNVLIKDLGCKNFGNEAFKWKKEITSIINVYKEQNLKAIILLGQEAWSAFLQMDSIPKGVPFFSVYASKNGIELPTDTITAEWMPKSVNMVSKANSFGTGGGFINEYNVVKNIELIKSFYPQVKNIAFVSDDTYGGVSLQSLVISKMKNYSELMLTLIDGRKVTTDVAEKIIAKLPKHTVVLLGTWRATTEGISIANTSLERLTSANPKIPVFSLSGTGIGNGAIGGYIPKYGVNAKSIVDQIELYYSGISNSVTFIASGSEYRFDKQKLSKLGIREGQLPTGSVIISTEDPRISQYRTYIILISVVLLIMILLVIILTTLYSKNRMLRHSLEDNEAKLIESKEKAEESDKLKSAFLANMSHEIRTPLNAIVGFSDLLATETLEIEEKLQYNQLISQNSAILLSLINDILDISRLETGKVKFVFQDVNLNSLMEHVYNTTKHLHKVDIEYSYYPVEDYFILKTDPKRLIQVLLNLMTNANKFTEKGSIVLSCDIDQSQSRVLFSVTDTGCGVPKDKYKYLFRRFEKLDEFKQGTGLGLAICKQIVNKLGGEIWIDPSYKAGARFYFTHPI